MKSIEVIISYQDGVGTIETAYVYAVNEDGEGLFQWSRGQGIWNQLIGTADFKASKPEHIMRRLRDDAAPLLEEVKMIRGSGRGWK